MRNLHPSGVISLAEPKPANAVADRCASSTKAARASTTRWVSSCAVVTASARTCLAPPISLDSRLATEMGSGEKGVERYPRRLGSPQRAKVAEELRRNGGAFSRSRK
jgi:hypothetical protein